MNRAHANREAWHPQTRQDRDAVLRELDEVLTSPHFCNSKRYPTLLRHIVENTLAGKLDILKERTLGVEVFDRPPTYDTNSDTVVRYTAGEVRKRLLLYYSEGEHDSGVRITLPAGSYVAEFLHGPDGHQGEQRGSVVQENEQRGNEHAGRNDAALDETLSGAGMAAADRARSAKGERFTSTRVWLAAAIAAIVGVTSAVAVWRYLTHGQSAADAFWAPVVRDQRAVIVCTGSSVFAPQNKSGVQTAGKDIDYTFVSMQIASAIAQVSSVMEHSGTATQLAPAATTTLPDLREHSVALLGGYNNQWTLRLLQPLRFYFVQDQGIREIIADRNRPQVRWERDDSLPYSSADDYALVARFRDSTIDGWVVVMAGLGRNGTEAAAQFATSPHYMELLRDRVGSGFGNRNIETVLKVSVIDGKTGAPSILAVHSW
jgi:hypothetical protein